jgi:hypothetical protein
MTGEDDNNAAAAAAAKDDDDIETVERYTNEMYRRP